MRYMFSLTLAFALALALAVPHTTSKRQSERKVAKFQKNITKRGLVPETTSKKGYDYPVGPIVLGFFVYVIIGSTLEAQACPGMT
ncbi:hypothetical protein ACB094_04G027000 [Castanea mollissima]